ncbi:MAG: hypothetical protein P1U89_18820 [Verrucomicrobiales bacterium]|nr:hypothetical protein [Verrucomicrobiales bacterium]
MGFLVAEDFYTTGLQGGWDVFNDPTDAQERIQRNDFYWFIRNVGRSAKRENDRGRWGLGKIVYPACSRIRSFFAYSVRYDDRVPFLIGRSVLPIHPLNDDEWYCSEGFFGIFDEDNDFCIPVSSIDKIDEFREAFKIARTSEHPGTSLVIPFPVESLNAPALKEAVIRYYLWEIVNDRLEVIIETSKGGCRLNSQTLQKEINSIDSTSFDTSRMLNLWKFAVDAAKFDFDRDKYFTLSATSVNWTDRDNWLASEDLAKAREAFNDNNQLCFGIPVKVQRKGGVKVDSYFHVFLQSVPGLRGADGEYIRDGLTIVGQKMFNVSGIRCLVIAEHGPLAVLLGDSENPAHTRWIGSDLKGKYTYGPQTVSFVKNSAQKLVDWLVDSEAERDTDLLAEIFGIPLENPPKPGPKKKRKKKVKPPRPDLPPRDTPFYSVNKFEGGFRVTTSPQDRTADSRDFSSLAIQLQCAYEGSSGDPLKKHSPFDFDFNDPSQISIEAAAADYEIVSENEIKVFPTTKDFIVDLKGFDKNRDLYLKSTKLILEPVDS